MGCASATLRRSTSAVGVNSNDLRKVIESDPELKAMVDTFRNATLPRVKEDLAALARCFSKASSCVAAIRAALVSYHREKMGRKRRRQHRRKYADTITYLDKFMLAVDSFPGLFLDDQYLLEDDTMAVFLRERKKWIATRRQKLKWWHRVCSVVFTIAFVGVLTASVLLAFAGAAAVAVTAATACATAIKAVEPLVHAALDEGEMKLKEEEEVVEAMRDGELLVQKFKGLGPQAKRVVAELEYMVNHVEFARQWGYGEEAVEVAMAGMMQKMDEVERSVEELKGMMDDCRYSIQPFEFKFMKIVTN